MFRKIVQMKISCLQKDWGVFGDLRNNKKHWFLGNQP